MVNSRKQCYVRDDSTGKWRRVKATDIGKDVCDKKTQKFIGVLVAPNPNTNMLRMLLVEEGKIITLRP